MWTRHGLESKRSPLDQIAHLPGLALQVLQEVARLLVHVVQLVLAEVLRLDEPEEAVRVVARREHVRGVGHSEHAAPIQGEWRLGVLAIDLAPEESDALLQPAPQKARGAKVGSEVRLPVQVVARQEHRRVPGLTAVPPHVLLPAFQSGGDAAGLQGAVHHRNERHARIDRRRDLAPRLDRWRGRLHPDAVPVAVAVHAEKGVDGGAMPLGRPDNGA